MLNWRPSAPLEILKQRAVFFQRIRTFFNKRGYLEVDTPILSSHGITDVYLSQMKTTCGGKPYYLQTSPEYPMKRLLAAGSGPIFQLAKVFRDEELGRWHEPEFTMLEWYQLGIDHHALMDEVDTFLQVMIGSLPLVKQTYQAAFEKTCEMNPHQASLLELKACVERFGLGEVLKDETERDLYLFLLMSHVVEPSLAALPYPTALYDFPASQAALARVEKGVASRFEVYYQGIELANGFHELSDVNEQSARFETDKKQRREKGYEVAEVDPYFLAALASGLPLCSGVALGVDRLFALACQKARLKEVMAFGVERV